MPKNYYIILGIPSNSTQDDIKAAYRKLVKELHPDRFGDNYKPFLNVQEAYSVLSDPARRRDYDNTLDETGKNHKPKSYRESLGKNFQRVVEPLVPEQGHADSGGTRFKPAFQSPILSIASLFDHLAANSEDRRFPEPGRPENLTVVVRLTPEQARRGGDVRLTIPGRVQCPICGGGGGVDSFRCYRCHGAGRLNGELPFLLGYPPGIPDNHTVRLSLKKYGIRNPCLTVIFRVREIG